MTPVAHVPITCDLGALSPEERAREQTLLAEFKLTSGEPQETANGFRFVLRNDPPWLGRLGEFLALERLCCPFLNFELVVPAGRQPVSLHISGEPAVKPFVRSVFAG